LQKVGNQDTWNAYNYAWDTALYLGNGAVNLVTDNAMGGLFSRKKKKETKNAVTEKDRAVLQLKVQRDRLQKYATQIEKIIDKETEAAKELIKQKKKQKALLCLKKKKYQQSMLAKTEGQLINIEEMVNSIEFATMQAKVFDALSVGKTTLEKLNDQMKIEDVEKLMEDSQEAIDYQNQISEMLGTNLSIEDNAAAEKELLGMEEQDLAKEVKGMEVPDKPVTVAQPEKPVEKIPAKQPVVVESVSSPKQNKAKPKEVVLA